MLSTPRATLRLQLTMIYGANIVIVFVIALGLYCRLWCPARLTCAYIHTACARAYEECLAVDNIALQILRNVTMRTYGEQKHVWKQRGACTADSVA
jgi:hypothetical protein